MLSLVLLVMVVVVGYSTLVTPAAPARSPRRDGGLDLPRAVPMPPPAAPHRVRAGQVAVTREPRQLWKTWRGSEHWMMVTVIIFWPPHVTRRRAYTWLVVELGRLSAKLITDKIVKHWLWQRRITDKRVVGNWFVRTVTCYQPNYVLCSCSLSAVSARPITWSMVQQSVKTIIATREICAYKSFVLRRLRLPTLRCGGHENSECLPFMEDSWNKEM